MHTLNTTKLKKELVAEMKKESRSTKDSLGFQQAQLKATFLKVKLIIKSKKN